MSTQAPAYSIDVDPSDEPKKTKHSREAALDDRQFELLLQGANEIEDYRGLQARFIIFVAGRLGLRAGEIAHVRESWIDWHNGRIEIPSHQGCTKGKDGGRCGYCRASARQKVEHGTVTPVEARLILLEEGATLEDLGHGPYHDLRIAHQSLVDEQITKDEFDERIETTLKAYDGYRAYDRLERGAENYIEAHDVTFEEALAGMWSPKTSAGAREVPFDFSPRVELILEQFFDRFDRYPTSKTTINRRVDRSAENAVEMTKEDVWPHALRATAASRLAGRGLGTLPLQAMFGWKKISTAQVYIQHSSSNTQRALHSIHSL